MVAFNWNLIKLHGLNSNGTSFFPAQILGESFAVMNEVTMGISQRTQLLVFFNLRPEYLCWRVLDQKYLL